MILQILIIIRTPTFADIIFRSNMLIEVMSRDSSPVQIQCVSLTGLVSYDSVWWQVWLEKALFLLVTSAQSTALQIQLITILGNVLNLVLLCKAKRSKPKSWWWGLERCPCCLDLKGPIVYGVSAHFQHYQSLQNTEKCIPPPSLLRWRYLWESLEVYEFKLISRSEKMYWMRNL